MRNTFAEQAMRARAALDGRIAIAAAAFALAYAFVALLDRVGAPQRFVAAAGPAFTVAALAALGFLLHSMRVSYYYTAGRAVPPEHAGFANAAIFAALALPMAAAFAARDWFSGLPLGLFLGAAAGLLFLTPLLRKTAVFSLAGLLTARFPSRIPRIGVIGATAAASALVALAGHRAAVDALASLGASRVFGAFTASAAMLLIAGPGGLFSVIWVAAAAGAVAFLGLGWPAAAYSLRAGTPFSMFDAEAWRAAAVRLDAWGVTPAMSFGAGAAVALAVALGAAVLAPALTPAAATRDAARAKTAGRLGFVWIFALMFLAAACVAGAALALEGAAVGQPPERLPGSVYAASSRGFVTICGEKAGSPAEARKACAARALPPGAPLRAKDLRAARGDYLLASLPALAGMGASVSGLLASARIALALALAAAGLHACATAVGHEALYRMRGETDLTSRRLAIARGALVGVTGIGAALGAAGALEASTLLALALGISAAAVAPTTALAFWPRAQDRDAAIALAAGLLGVLAALAVGGGALTPERFALASLSGAVLGFALGAVSALSTSRDEAPARAFLRRMLHGDGEILAPDKGA